MSDELNTNETQEIRYPGSNFFRNDSYDDNPINGIEVETLKEQKHAVYTSDLNNNYKNTVYETFFTNNDEYASVQIKTPTGEIEKQIVFGKGAVYTPIVTYIKNATDFENEKNNSLKDYMQSEGHINEWVDGMEWAVANFSGQIGKVYATYNGEYAIIRNNGEGEPINPEVTVKSTYIIVDRGEVFHNGEVAADVEKIGFVIE